MDTGSPRVSQVSRRVPKFASFRPREESYKPLNEDVEHTEKDLVPDPPGAKSLSSNSLNVRYGHSFSGVHRFDGVNTLSSSKELPLTRTLLQPVTLEENNESEPLNSFLVDRIGDSNNLAYGSLPKSGISSYLRFGGGNILGFPAEIKIDREQSSDKSIRLQCCYHDHIGKSARNFLYKARRYESKTLHIRSSQSQPENINLAADFIPFNDESGKDIERNDGEGWSVDDQSSSPKRLEPTECHSFTTTDDVLYQKMVLSRTVEEEPGNCDAWLELIDLQDGVLGTGATSMKSRSAAERQSTADLKISLYEKAIQSAKTLEDKERLLLGMMQEGSQIWGNSKLSFKWRNIIKNNPTSLSLWRKYLDFRQSDFRSFRYEEVYSAYLDCLVLLQQTRWDAESSTIDPTPAFIMQLYVILRMTVYMREAGFSEHATACWQAVVEFNFHKPAQYRQLTGHKNDQTELEVFSSFEAFWESEVPRFGEENAEGWASFTSKGGKPTASKRDAIKGVTSIDHDFQSWIRLERQKSLWSRLPARTVDDTDDNDVYRVILFSDIRPVLINSPKFIGKSIIIDALLTFCHLPLCFASDRTRLWLLDPFLRNEMVHQAHDLLELTTPKEGSFIRATKSRPYPSKNEFLLLPMHFYRLSFSSLFAAKGAWFSAFDSWENEMNDNQGPVELEFVRRLLTALVNHGIGGDRLAEYQVAFEMRLSPSTAKKVVKNLIKRQPSSLRLYRSYAVVEYRLGNPATADHVMITSINMSKSLSEQAQRDCILLWPTWIWELLDLGGLALALERISMFSDEVITIKPLAQPLFPQEPTHVAPALSLRIQKALIATRDHFTSLALDDHTVSAIECLMLFAYLSSELSLEAARATFTSNLSFLSTHFQQNSSNHEHVHQAFARILHFHVSQVGRFKPSIIRSFLTESITQFPQNTIFLALYAWIESRSRIDDRVRSIMRDIVLASHRNRRIEDKESIVSYFFAIYSELSRGINLGSNTSVIRSSFESAVASGCGAAHSAALWKLYFLFEHSRGDLQLAKSVFYRALRACPWSKELYLLSFEYLPSIMDAQDLKGVYANLVERELRIHSSLELDEVFKSYD